MNTKKLIEGTGRCAVEKKSCEPSSEKLILVNGRWVKERRHDAASKRYTQNEKSVSLFDIWSEYLACRGLHPVDIGRIKRLAYAKPGSADAHLWQAIQKEHEAFREFVENRRINVRALRQDAERRKRVHQTFLKDHRIFPLASQPGPDRELTPVHSSWEGPEIESPGPSASIEENQGNSLNLSAPPESTSPKTLTPDRRLSNPPSLEPARKGPNAVVPVMATPKRTSPDTGGSPPNKRKPNEVVPVMQPPPMRVRPYAPTLKKTIPRRAPTVRKVKAEKAPSVKKEKTPGPAPDPTLVFVPRRSKRGAAAPAAVPVPPRLKRQPTKPKTPQPPNVKGRPQQKTPPQTNVPEGQTNVREKRPQRTRRIPKKYMD